MWKASNTKYVSSTEAESSTRYIYIGKRFHFGKLYCPVKSQMTRFTLPAFNEKKKRQQSFLVAYHASSHSKSKSM